MQSWQPNLDGVPGPIYRAIADAIGQAVAQGRLRAGDRLPPQRSLADSMGVDLTTVTRAYTEARHRGLVDAVVGRGTFVRAAGVPTTGVPAGGRAVGVRADVRASGIPAGARVAGVRVAGMRASGIPAGARVAGVRVAGMRAAGVPAGTAPRTSEERQAADMRGVDMSMNMPPQPPLLRQLLREGLTAQLHETALADLMTYRAGPGTGRDRAMAAAWLAPVMGEVDPGRILVCGGAQSALTGLLTMLAKPGDVILTEALTYPGFRAVAAQLGIRLIGVPTDDEGPLPEALEQACRAARPKAFYCGPTIQNPTTVTTSLARRQAVAEIALRHGISIIEDDAYGMLPEAPLAAIATLAPAACFYIGTVAKCLSPGLRCAYVVAPDRPLAGRLAGAIRATSLSPSPLLTGLVTRWIGDGSAIRLRDAVRDEARARQVMARTILPADAIAAHPDGLHLWLTLPAHWNRLDFSAHLRGRGLTLVPSDAFLVEGQAPNAVRMSLGVAETQEALREALLAVAAAMTADAPSNYAEIV